MKKKIAIIGAGIAGLTLANFLKKFSNNTVKKKEYKKPNFRYRRRSNTRRREI